MKFLAFYSSLFFCVVSYSHNTGVWNKLLESAHDIGYCLYNINQQFCNKHIDEYNRLVEEASEVEPEEHYFVMREKWAKDRVTDWAQRVTSWEGRSELKADNLILFFRIPKGFVDRKIPIATINTTFSFFVVNLEDDLKLSIDKRYKNIALYCTISHQGKPNMLWNILWREFMSGRPGLVENKVEFTVFSDSEIRKKFRIFKRRFKRLMKQF